MNSKCQAELKLQLNIRASWLEYYFVSIRRIIFLSIVSLTTIHSPAALSEGISEVYESITSGKLKDAKIQIISLLEKSPEDPELLFARAIIVEKIGDIDQAVKFYQALTISHPDLLEPYNNLAIHHARQGNYKEAIETLERALEANPAVATAYQNLTAIYARLASAAYRKALNSSASPEPLRLSSLDKIESLQFLPVQIQPTLVASVDKFVNETLQSDPQQSTSDIASNTSGLKDSPTNPVSSPATNPVVESTPKINPTDNQVSLVTDQKAEKKTEKKIAQKSETATTDSKASSIPQSTSSLSEEEAVLEKSKPVVVASLTPTAEALQAVEDNAAQKQALINQIKSWADAWGDRDVDRYLSHYSDKFNPRNNLSLPDWKKQRYGRLRWREFIVVKPSKYSISVNGKKATVNFTQYYKSDRFEDTIRKTLKFRNQNGRWLIVRELI